MTISELTIDRLKEYIVGDSEVFSRPTAPIIVTLFQAFGSKDIYYGHLPDGPTRQPYTLKKVRELNGKPEMKEFLEAIMDPGTGIRIAP